MRDLLLDLALPRTDRAVGIQWLIMAPIWLIAVVAVRRQIRDIRHFVWGLALMNFAWFMARMIH